jgi:hypothetical protein
MPQRTPRAPALPLDILLARLPEFCTPRLSCQILGEHAISQEIGLRCQQIADVRDIAEGEHNVPISVNVLATTFECPRSRVQSTLAHVL